MRKCTAKVGHKKKESAKFFAGCFICRNNFSYRDMAGIRGWLSFIGSKNLIRWLHIVLPHRIEPILPDNPSQSEKQNRHIYLPYNPPQYRYSAPLTIGCGHDLSITIEFQSSQRGLEHPRISGPRSRLSLSESSWEGVWTSYRPLLGHNKGKRNWWNGRTLVLLHQDSPKPCRFQSRCYIRLWGRFFVL